MVRAPRMRCSKFDPLPRLYHAMPIAGVVPRTKIDGSVKSSAMKLVMVYIRIW